MIGNLVRCRAIAFLAAAALLVPPVNAPAQDSPPAEGDLTPSDSRSCDLTGEWRSTFGLLSIRQVKADPRPEAVTDGLDGPLEPPSTATEENEPDTFVTGRYRAPSGEGQMTGFISNGRFEVRWFQAETFAPPDDAGDGYFDISPDCNSLTGYFRTGFEGEMTVRWAARRVSGAATLPPDRLMQLEAAKAQAEVGFAALEARRARLPRDEFAVPALAENLGPGTEAAFRHLRDRIGLDPYSGVLRGARGTLLAKGGNAADRSLLLAALLKQGGFTTRFALGTLADDAAGVLADRVLTAPPPRPEAALDAGDLVEQLGLDAAFYAEQQAKAAAARTGFLAGIASESEFQAEVLAGILDRGGFAPARRGRAEIIAGLREHVWLQVEQDGTWLDLDPAFPGAEPGQTFTTATETVDALPEALFHKIQFIAALERKEGETLATENLGGWELKTATVMDSDMPGFWAPIPSTRRRFRGSPGRSRNLLRR
jgi:transglutaminase-like putative cysteine protease